MMPAAVGKSSLLLFVVGFLGVVAVIVIVDSSSESSKSLLLMQRIKAPKAGKTELQMEHELRAQLHLANKMKGIALDKKSIVTTAFVLATPPIENVERANQEKRIRHWLHDFNLQADKNPDMKVNMTNELLNSEAEKAREDKLIGATTVSAVEAAKHEIKQQAKQKKIATRRELWERANKIALPWTNSEIDALKVKSANDKPSEHQIELARKLESQMKLDEYHIDHAVHDIVKTGIDDKLSTKDDLPSLKQHYDDSVNPRLDPAFHQKGSLFWMKQQNPDPY